MIRAIIKSFLISVTFLLLSGCKKSHNQSSNSFSDLVDATTVDAINTVAVDTVNTVAVPEPSTLLLMAAGLGGLALWRKRMK